MTMLRFVWLEVWCTVNELGGCPEEGRREDGGAESRSRTEGRTTRASAPRQAVKEAPGLGEDYGV